jgi:hypothetical protein
LEISLKNILENIIERLKKGDYKNEEHVRLSLVLRILFELGWDIWNPQEVNSEFFVVPNEDRSRVDLALFLQPYWKPTIFIEIKAVGKLLQYLLNIEIDVRNYNRNNTAPMSIITDGQYWRFYLSSAGGEFSSKCFEKIDLLDENKSLDDLQLVFDSFLSKEALVNGQAIEDAKIYHRRTEKERFVIEALPAARKDAEDDPTTSLVDCLIKRCLEYGFEISKDEAAAFIRNNRSISVATRTSNLSDRKAANSSITVPKNIPLTKGNNINLKHLESKRGAKATGYELPNRRFIVLKDSVATKDTMEFLGDSNSKIRTDLIDSGIFNKTSNGYVLNQDYEFNTSSQAACVFLGCSASGPREWKDGKRER